MSSITRKIDEEGETPSLYCHPIESDHLSTDELAVLNIVKAELYQRLLLMTADERVSLARQASTVQYGKDDPDWITVYALMSVSETNKNACLEVSVDRDNYGHVETAVAYARFVEMERELGIISKRRLSEEKTLPQNKWSAPLVPDSGAMDGVPGMKFDQGKLDWSLLPWVAVAEVVKVMEYGAKKYARDNWQKVLEAKRRYFSATIRHLLARMNGERTDEESGLLHLAHAACCVLFLLALDVWGKLEDQDVDTTPRS